MTGRLSRALCALALSLGSAVSPAQASAPAPALGADTIAAELLARLAAAGSGTGAIVVVIDGSGSISYHPAGTEAAGAAPVTADTRFEAGSITKALTGSLLARLAARGVVRLDDPVDRWVPALQGRAAGALTLQQLATHTSGLPRVPRQLAFWWALIGNRADPYADYSAAQMLDYLAGWRGDAPAPFDYSNLGYALLGHALQGATGTPFADLLRREILAPAGLPQAPLSPAETAAGPMATGHDGRGRSTAAWSAGAFAAAGALRASALEMAALLEQARRGRPPFDAGAAQPLATRGDSARAIGLGWLRTERHGDRLVWHNGGTGGFRAFAGYSEVSGRAVAVLANGIVPLDDLGLHLLNPAFERQAVGAQPPAAPTLAGTWITPLVLLVALMAPLRWAWSGPQQAATTGWRARWLRAPDSRLELALVTLGFVLLLAFFWQVGSWVAPAGLDPRLPWLLLGLAVSGTAAWRWRHLPGWPATGAGRRRLGWSAFNAVVAAALATWVWL